MRCQYSQDNTSSEAVLSPVYTGDFCRSNSMQFLLRLSCNFKNRTCKPGAIFISVCRRTRNSRCALASLSSLFASNTQKNTPVLQATICQELRTCLKLDATLVRQKLHRVDRDKNRLCKRAFRLSQIVKLAGVKKLPGMLVY